MTANFNLTLGELGSTRSPHRVFSLLAMDAAMNALEDPHALSDEELCRLAQAADTAAGALLKLLGMPDDWSEFVARVSQLKPLREMESSAKERLFELLPPPPRTWLDECNMLLQIIRESAHNESRLHSAVLDFECHSGLMANQGIEDAFALGFQASRDASKFLFKTDNGK